MNNKKEIYLFVLIVAIVGVVTFAAVKMLDGGEVSQNDNIKTGAQGNLNSSSDAGSSSAADKINTDTNNTNNSSSVQSSDTKKNMNEKNYTQATLHTSMGDIAFEFAATAPKTVANFQKLASIKFYDGVKFHRVIKGFMIQTGDPLSKEESMKSRWGTGGPDYRFADELSGSEKYVMGTVAMANAGPNTNGSQFFIMTSNTALPPSYTVFGKVIMGQDIAQKIQEVAVDGSDKPLQNITINSVELK